MFREFETSINNESIDINNKVLMRNISGSQYHPIVNLDGVVDSDNTGKKAIDIIDKKFDGLRFVRITKIDYDALETKDDKTVYIITKKDIPRLKSDVNMSSNNKKVIVDCDGAEIYPITYIDNIYRDKGKINVPNSIKNIDGRLAQLTISNINRDAYGKIPKKDKHALYIGVD